jgi:hypothetical protein
LPFERARLKASVSAVLVLNGRHLVSSYELATSSELQDLGAVADAAGAAMHEIGSALEDEVQDPIRPGSRRVATRSTLRKPA